MRKYLIAALAFMAVAAPAAAQSPQEETQEITIDGSKCPSLKFQLSYAGIWTCVDEPAVLTASDSSVTLATTGSAKDDDMPIAVTDLIKAAAVIRFEARNETGGIARAIERAASVLEKCARYSADGLKEAKECEALK